MRLMCKQNGRITFTDFSHRNPLALIADLAAGALAKAQLIDQQTRKIGEMQTLAQVSEVVTSRHNISMIFWMSLPKWPQK